MQNPPRPQLTSQILYYAAIDVLGIVLFASGLMWLIRGQSLFFTRFPTSTMGAAATTAVGLFLMIWAAAQILRQLINSVASKLNDDR